MLRTLETGYSDEKVIDYWYAIEFSGDGKVFAKNCSDDTIRVWDVWSGRLLGAFSDKSGRAKEMALSLDGRVLASLYEDGAVKLFDVSQPSLGAKIFAKSDVSYIEFSPDGMSLAGASVNGLILWSLKSGLAFRRIPFNGIDFLAFSPDGLQIAVSVGGVSKVVTGRAKGIADADHIIDGKIQIWDVSTGKLIRSFADMADPANPLMFSPDGKMLASGDGNRTIKLWDVSRGKLLRKMVEPYFMKTPYSSRFGVHDFQFSPDGKAVASIYSGDGLNNEVTIWDVASGRRLRALECFASQADSAAISTKNQFLAFGISDVGVRLWDLATGRPARNILSPGDWFNMLAFSPNDRYVAGGTLGGAFIFWDARTGEEAARALAGSEGTNGEVSFSRDGQTIATFGGNQEVIRVWDLKKHRLIRVISTHIRRISPTSISRISAVSFTSSDRILECCSDDGTILTFDVASGQLVHKVSTNTSTDWEAKFSNGGKILACSYDTGIVRIWDPTSGRLLHEFPGGSHVSNLAFSNDGHILAVASDDNMVRLWVVETGHLLTTLAGHSENVASLAFSSDGTKLLTSSSDNTAKLWDVNSGLELCSIISWEDGAWAVTDPEGRFDGSNGGKIEGLHWVLDDPVRKRMEPIGLNQFAGSFYTPGLLSKIWKREKLPAVPSLKDLALYPEVRNLKVSGSRLSAELVDQGGGYGEVHIFVNGIQVKTLPGTSRIDVDLGSVLAGRKNPDVQIYAYNSNNIIHSRRIGGDGGEIPPESPNLAPERIVAVVGAVQHFPNANTDSNMDLRYCDADALSVTKAVQAMAKGLGEKTQVHIELICDDPSAKGSDSVTVHPATKSGFDAAFLNAAKLADANSVLLVYLSGHGTALKKQGLTEFYYLTDEARNSDPSSLAMNASRWALSGTEIHGYLQKAIDCRRRFVVLDTCEAGAYSLKGPDDQARAQRDFQEGTGSFMLMGAAKDRSSLEDDIHGHGLLTYALLDTLKNRQLGGDRHPDAVPAVELIKKTMERTSEIARDLHQEQKANFAEPDTGTDLILGQMTKAARGAIQLRSPLPLMLPPQLQDPATFDSSLGLSLGELLRQVSVKTANRPSDAPFVRYLSGESSAPGAFRLQGSYSKSGNSMHVRAKVFRNGKLEPKPFPSVTGSENEILQKLVGALRTWFKPQ